MFSPFPSVSLFNSSLAFSIFMAILWKHPFIYMFVNGNKHTNSSFFYSIATCAPKKETYLKQRCNPFFSAWEVKHHIVHHHATYTCMCSFSGVQTPNCIRQTVFDAVALDYEKVTVLIDATAAARPEIHLCESINLLYYFPHQNNISALYNLRCVWLDCC